MVNSEILQEYLIKLGYQTDALSLRRFEDSLGGTTKRLLKAGTAVTGIVAATGAATTAFAYNMRRMYFASELSNSSVKNLKAVEYASKQVGIANGAMEASIHSLAQSIRLQPGMEQFINSLGVATTGRDVSDVAVDLVSALSKMPEWQGVQFAEMFGLDPDTYHMLISHLDEFKAKQAESKKIFDEMGVSFEDHEKVVKQYTGTLDRLNERAEALGTTILQKMVGPFDKVARVVDETMEGLNSALQGNTLEEQFNAWKKNPLPGMTGPSFSKRAENAQKTPTGPGWLEGVGNSASNIGSSIMDFFIKKGWAEEHAAGITASLEGESGFNPKAVGDSGKAYGLAQWHPDRQKAFEKWAGHDIRQSTMEEQLEFVNHELVAGNERRAGVKLRGTKTRGEAARAVTEFYERPADIPGAGKARARLADAYKSADVTRAITELYERPTDVARKALAYKSAGQIGTQTAASMGILDNTKLTGGLSNGATITQNNTFNITGTGAEQIGKSVADKQINVNRDIVRNLSGGPR